MKYWIILVAGPVVFGACAFKRQTETKRQVAADITVQAGYSAFGFDSLTGIRDRSLMLERHWEHAFPKTGAIHRYTEQVRLSGRDSLAVSHTSGVGVRTETHRAVRMDERRSDRRQRQPVSWGWLGILLGVAVALFIVFKRFWFWPFR